MSDKELTAAMAVVTNNQGEGVPSPPPNSSQHPSTRPPQTTFTAASTTAPPSSDAITTNPPPPPPPAAPVGMTEKALPADMAVATNNQGEEVPSPPPDSSQHPSTPPNQIITNCCHNNSTPIISHHHTEFASASSSNPVEVTDKETQTNTENIFSWPQDEECLTGLDTILKAFVDTLSPLEVLGFALTKTDPEIQLTRTGRVDINTKSPNDELMGGKGLDLFMTM